jgi:hypothetical protein
MIPFSPLIFIDESVMFIDEKQFLKLKCEGH